MYGGREVAPQPRLWLQHANPLIRQIHTGRSRRHNYLLVCARRSPLRHRADL